MSNTAKTVTPQAGAASGKKAPTPSTIRIGRRYRPARLAENYDAIVIGSGIGGLTTAACLSKMGKKVLVLEQHYTAGGYTHSYSRNGYEWDVGVHYIGEAGRKSSLTGKMFDFVSDGKLQWAPMDRNYDRFFIGDERYDLVAGKKQYVANLKKRFPEEEQAIDEYMTRLAAVSRAIQVLSAEKLFSGVAGKLFKMVRKAALPSYLNRTTDEVLSELTDNEMLKAVITGQWGDSGVTPAESSFIIHCLIANHYLKGAYYPVGGASQIAETIIPVIQRSGGEVFTYADVEQILVRRNRARGVRMADGTEIEAPIVISNAGVFNTFQHLLPEQVSRRNGYHKLISKVRPSSAHIGAYIGLQESAEQLDLPKTNFWIYPGTRHEEQMAAFAADHNAPFPAVYISFPSAKDPSWEERYPGTATIEIVAPANFELFERWKDEPWGKRGEEYDELKDALTERLLECLYEKLPQLRGKIDYCELSTPLSTDFFCRYGRGEMYGLNHDTQRFDQEWLRPRTRIKGLFLTGQDILSCGVGGAMFGGFVAAVSVLGLAGGGLLKRFGAPAKPAAARPGEVVSQA